MGRLYLFVIMVITLIVSPALSKPLDQKVWTVVPVDAETFYFYSDKLKASAILRFEVVGLKEKDFNDYISSPQFFVDAQRSRLNSIFKVPRVNPDNIGYGIFDMSGSVEVDRETISNVSVGIIETDFDVNGRSALMSERIWFKDGIAFQFLIGSVSTMTPTSESHAKIFEQFQSDLGFMAKKPSKSASLMNAILPYAEAREIIKSKAARGSRALPRRSPHASSERGIYNCRLSADEMGIQPATRAIDGPPEAFPALNLDSCKAGIEAAHKKIVAELSGYWQSMKDAGARAAQAFADENERQKRILRCRPPGKTEWDSVSKALRSSANRVAYADCVALAGVRASGYLAGRAAVSGAEWAADKTVQASRAVADWMTNGGPERLSHSFAKFIAGGGPAGAIYRFVAANIKGFACLKSEDKTIAICEFATSVAEVAVLGVATGGTAAVATKALRTGIALARGLNRAAKVAKLPDPPAATSIQQAVRPAPTVQLLRARTRTVATANSETPNTTPRTLGSKSQAAEKKSLPRTPERPSVFAEHGNVVTRLDAEDMVNIAAMGKKQAWLTRDVHSALMQTTPDTRITARLIDLSFGDAKPVTGTVREVLKQAAEKGRRIEVDQIHMEMPNLDGVARSKIGGELLERDGIFKAQVEFKSGEIANFSGTKEQLAHLARESNVKQIAEAEWGSKAPELSRVSHKSRAEGHDVVQSRIAQLPAEARTTTKASDLSDMQVFHGTVEMFEDSVRAGPRDIGKGYGGRGLYLAIQGEKELAEDYAKLARKQALDRAEDYNIKTQSASDRPVVLEGRVNPEREMKVGVFRVERDGQTNLSRGILGGPDWQMDPGVRRALESEFDILDVRGASSSGVPGLTDRFLVIHERAGRDAIVWKPRE